MKTPEILNTYNNYNALVESIRQNKDEIEPPPCPFPNEDFIPKDPVNLLKMLEECLKTIQKSEPNDQNVKPQLELVIKELRRLTSNQDNHCQPKFTS
jgi:hypothetical protein